MSLRQFIKMALALLFLFSTARAVEFDRSQKLSASQLTDMLKKYQKDLFIEGQIKQEKWIKELDLRLKSQGTFKIHKMKSADLIIDWSILKPEALHVCIEGSQIYIRDSGQKAPIQQDLNKMGDQSQISLSTLRSLMAMDTERLFKDFIVYKMAKKILFESKTSTILLTLDSNDLMQEIHFIEPSGDELKINFSAVKPTKKNLVSKNCLSRLGVEK